MNRTKKSRFEMVAEYTVQRFFTLWMMRVRENLPLILKGKDFRELPQNSGKGHSCIIVAGGPSVEKHQHLKLLADSKYQGVVVSTDRRLKDLLTYHIQPSITVSCDPQDGVLEFFPKDCSGIGVFSVITPRKVFEQWKGEVYWFIPILDTLQGNSLTKALHIILDKTAIDTLGNVSSLGYVVARWLGCEPICFIGMDLSWPTSRIEDTPLYQYLRLVKKIPRKVILKEHQFKTLKTDYGVCTTEISFEIYKTALCNAIEQLEPKVETYNCTEGGVFDTPSVKRMKLIEFLEKYSK